MSKRTRRLKMKRQAALRLKLAAEDIALKMRLAESPDLPDSLDQQSGKLSKTISDVTALLAKAHTAYMLDKRAEPALKNVYRALNRLISAKSTLTTARLYLQKLRATKVKNREV